MAIASENRCADVWQIDHSNPSKYRQRDALSEKERSELRAFIRDSRLPGREKWDYALRYYVHRRLQFAPKEHVAELTRRIDDFLDAKIEFDLSDNKVDGSVSKIILPDSLRDSPIVAVMKAHEIEHLIEFYILSKDSPWQAVHITRSLIDPSKHYYEEERAMSAEWEIGSLVPEEMIVEELVLVSQLPIPADVKVMLSRQLQNSVLSKDEYLRAEHKAGRYSWRQVIQLKIPAGSAVALQGVMLYNMLARSCGFPVLFGH